MKENLSQKQIQIQNLKIMRSNATRHLSVLYGIEYITKVSMVKRCRKTEYECFDNIKKKDIFIFVQRFIEKLLSSEEFLANILGELKFTKNQFQTAIVQTKKKLKIICLKNCNHLNQQTELDQSGEELFEQTNSYHKPQKKLKSCKKLSIKIDSDFDFDHESSKSTIFSDESLKIISLNGFTQQQFNLKMVESIYEQPEPFLINLSVCLILKFLFLTKTSLTKKNVCLILSIGTIVAYKIYYDEPVEGLIDSFAYILKASRQDIISLQRSFLSGIDFEAVISNQQYHITLYHIIKQEHNEN